MNEIFHKNFHIIEKLSNDEGKRDRHFILEEWKPKEDIWLIGCAIGLLCSKSDNFELYLAVSKDPKLAANKRYFIGLKKDWLFYQQRDVYTYSSGINDLMNYQFLPEGTGFLIKKRESLYIKVGALNLDSKPRAYDAFCNLYYRKRDHN